MTGRRLLPRPHYFYKGLVSFLHSSEQGIQLQRLVGGGIGRFLKDTDRLSIAVSGGVAWQRTNYDQSVFSLPAQDVGAALAGIELKLFRFDKTNVNIETGALPSFSDPGRVYIATNVSYFIKLFGKLSGMSILTETGTPGRRSIFRKRLWGNVGSELVFRQQVKEVFTAKSHRQSVRKMRETFPVWAAYGRQPNRRIRKVRDAIELRISTKMRC